MTLELIFVYHIAASGASSLLWLCNGTDYVPAVYLTTLRSFFKELHTYVRMWTTKYHAQTGILVSFSYIQHISSVFKMFPGVPLRARGRAPSISVIYVNMWFLFMIHVIYLWCLNMIYICVANGIIKKKIQLLVTLPSVRGLTLGKGATRGTPRNRLCLVSGNWH